MSHLIARILLSILMFPLAGMVYTTVFAVLMERSSWSRHYETASFGAAGLACWGFLAIYWLLLWRSSVRWTVARVWLTLGAAGASLLVSGLVGLFIWQTMGGGSRDWSFPIFVAGVLAPLLWVCATILLWRETAAERRARLESVSDAIVCPTCGYNLTGLSSTRCPECGTTYRLDQLLREQPARADGELENT